MDDMNSTLKTKSTTTNSDSCITTSARTVFPNFPYSINDEPTEDWTVEQVLQLCLLQSYKKTDESYLKLLNQLKQEMESGKMEILQCHKEAMDGMEQTLVGNHRVINNNSHDINDENKDNSNGKPMQIDDPAESTKIPSNDCSTKTVTSGSGDGQATAMNTPNNIASTVFVEIIAGHYSGKTFELQPKARYPCWVGRSTGKKFRGRGISVPKDLEVSTTHAKFEIIDDILCFTDTGSTNGTKFGGNELEPNHPIKLVIGQEFIIGQTILKIAKFA